MENKIHSNGEKNNPIFSISWYPNKVAIADSRDVLLSEELNKIRHGAYREEVQTIRDLFAENQSKSADELKGKLPALTISGVFKGGRKASDLVKYNQLIVLDIDDLSLEEITEVIEKIKVIPFTFYTFKSPSSVGVKIIVRVSTGAEHHKLAYEQVQNYYEQYVDVKIDTSGKDVNRLCFVSYDPDLYENLDAEVFYVQLADHSTNSFGNKQTRDEIFAKAVSFTQRLKVFEEGSRNNFIHLLACNCNRLGIMQGETLSYMLKSGFNYDEHEIVRTVQSAYQNNLNDFATFAHSARLENEDDHTPVIPALVYDHLPKCLKEPLSKFTVQRECDALLTATLCVLSGCFSRLSGQYDGRTYYPNLFSFVVAPPASGKGVIVYARRVGEKIHQEFITESELSKKLFEAQQKALKDNKGSIPDDIEEPPFKALFIPANASSAVFIKRLNDTDESCIMFETEADTLVNSLKQDWGNYSDSLRKAFQHEPISYTRRTNDVFIEVNEPRLSVVLCGTPAQFNSLVDSAENGLFSRFIFYTYSESQGWHDVSPRPEANYDVYFEGLGSKVAAMAKYLKAYPTKFTFSSEQWKSFNAHFELLYKEIENSFGDEALSVVKRMGVITFRIAMLLSTIRKAENQEKDSRIQCLDIDFESALELGKVYIRHAMHLYKKLPKQQNRHILNAGITRQRFFDSLSNVFTRKEAVLIGRTQLNIAERTVDKYLKEFLKENLLESEVQGRYRKV